MSQVHSQHLPLSTFPARGVNLLSSLSSHGHLRLPQVHSWCLHSMGLDKCIRTCTYHYSIIWSINIFTARKMFHNPPIFIFPPIPRQVNFLKNSFVQVKLCYIITIQCILQSQNKSLWCYISFYQQYYSLDTSW